MKIRSFGRLGFAVLSSSLLTLSACGDDGTTTPGSDTTGSDTTQRDGTEDDATQPDATEETTAPADTTDADTTTDTSNNDTNTNDTADSDASVGPAVTTATITLGGTTHTVTPNVRRGFAFAQAQSKTAGAIEFQPVTLSCGPKVLPDEGGRIIIVRDASIGGGFGGLCGQNLAVIDSADTEASRVTSVACSSRHDCTFNPWDTVFQMLEECTTSDLGISIDYDCVPLNPAPAFVLEYLGPEVNLTLSGLDGVGPASCDDRNARIAIDGALATFAADEPCEITIDNRTANTLSGSMTATVVLGDGTRKDLDLTFRHDLNTRRPIAGVNTGTDLCATNELSHTTAIDGEDTIDTITVGTLMCQANPNATLPGFTMALRRPRAGAPDQDFRCGQRIALTSDGRGTDFSVGGFCERVFRVDEQLDALRAAFYNVTLCASLSDCAPVMPIVYIQYSFDNLVD